jgi:phospholipid/cholesterol/gamma-HCH transport system permease protein
LDAVLDWWVRPVMEGVRVVRRLSAFALIVLATTLTRFGVARSVVHPLIWDQIRRAGLGLLPMVLVVSGVSGLVLIGQAVTLLRQVGAQDLLGTVLVVGLFRELAPLGTALVVLLRVGTGTVVELATIRATGEVEALEALSIDPVHFLVVPRVVGMAVSVLCLTVYFLIGAILSGYAYCFLMGLPLSLRDYLNGMAMQLAWHDFLLLILKTGAFGAGMAVITCYQGLARPMGLEQLPEATTRAVTHSLIFCISLDLIFLGLYPLF